MAIGDFNFNLMKQSIFGFELIKFCNENGYVLSKQNKLPGKTVPTTTMRMILCLV